MCLSKEDLFYKMFYGLVFKACCSFSELNEKHGWYKLNYARTFNLGLEFVRDNVERVDADQVSAAEFIEKYEKVYKPCVVVNTQKDWLANEKWSPTVST